MCRKIKIYTKKDLKTKDNRRVSNGKLSAQSAHSLMASFLCLFKKTNEGFVLNEKNKSFFFDVIKEKIEIDFILVSSKEFDFILKENKETAIVIEDQGRTSFKEKTITSMAILPNEVFIEKNIDCKKQKATIQTKQTFIINKSEIENKNEMIKEVSLISLKVLFDLVQYDKERVFIPFLGNSNFEHWVNDSFAKIVLKPIDLTFEDFVEKHKKATDIITKANKKVIVFGPSENKMIDYYTKIGCSLV